MTPSPKELKDTSSRTPAQGSRSDPGSTWHLLVTAIVATAFLVAGCANDVDVFTPRDDLNYSVQASFRVKDDTHFVRVESLQDGIAFGADSTLDATVTMEDLSTGETVTLTDSLVRFGEALTHNFWTTMQLRPETTYRLTVTRSDGATTTAQATTPVGAVDPELFQIEKHCLSPIQVTFPGNIGLVETRVGFFTEDRPVWVRFPVELPRSASETSLSFVPHCELEPIVGRVDTTGNPRLTITRCEALRRDSIPVAYLRVGDDWPRNIEELADPSTRLLRSVNVERGTGFFGFVRRDTFVTTIDRDLRPVRDFPPPMGPPCAGYEAQLD